MNPCYNCLNNYWHPLISKKEKVLLNINDKLNPSYNLFKLKKSIQK